MKKSWNIINAIVFIFLIFAIIHACKDQIMRSDSKIIVRLTQPERVESWHFRFVKVDTTLHSVVSVDKDFNISFTQADTLTIPDTTQLFFIAGIDTIQEVVFPDSIYHDSLIVIEYENNELTKGIWYLTISTRFKGHEIQSFWSKPVWFEVVGIFPIDSSRKDLKKNEIH
jgi:hypothetical protein